MIKTDSCHVAVAPDVGPKLCLPGEVEVSGRCRGETSEKPTPPSHTESLETQTPALCFLPGCSCCSSSSVSTHHRSGTCGPERPPQVLLRPPTVGPTPGLPGGLGQAHQPQHEGGDQAGIHAEALFSGGDGWRSVQARRNGNSRQDVPGV